MESGLWCVCFKLLLYLVHETKAGESFKLFLGCLCWEDEGGWPLFGGEWGIILVSITFHVTTGIVSLLSRMLCSV